MIKEKKCLPIFLSDTKNTHCFDINQYWNFIFTDLTFSHRWWCIIIFLSPNYENPSSYLIYFFYFHWVAYSKFFLQFFFLISWVFWITAIMKCSCQVTDLISLCCDIEIFKRPDESWNRVTKKFCSWAFSNIYRHGITYKKYTHIDLEKMFLTHI